MRIAVLGAKFLHRKKVKKKKIHNGQSRQMSPFGDRNEYSRVQGNDRQPSPSADGESMDITVDSNETSSLSSFVHEFETFADEVKEDIPEVDFRGRLNRERSESGDTAELGISVDTSSQLSVRSDKQVNFIKALLSPRTPYEEFHRLFKNVPKDQFPINDFSCALSREILLQGRIYISQGWFCFYSNIFGWETEVTIDCSKVQSITREKTAYIVPNAILIVTNEDKHFFSSFLSRETVYKLVVQVWEDILTKSKNGKTIVQTHDTTEEKEASDGHLEDDLHEGIEEGQECTNNNEMQLQDIEGTSSISCEVESKSSADSGIFDCQAGVTSTEPTVSLEETGVKELTAGEETIPCEACLQEEVELSSSRLPSCASIAVLLASLAEMMYSYCQVSFRLIRRLSREQLFYLVTTFLIVCLMSCSAFLLYRLSILEPRVLAPSPPPSRVYLQQSIQQIIQLRREVHEAEVTRVRSIVSANLVAISQIRETLEMLQDDLTNHMTRNCTLMENNMCIKV